MKKRIKTIGKYWSFKQFFIKMKLTFAFVLMGLMAVSASTYSQNNRLNVSLKNNSLIEAFREIEQQSGFYFFFKKEEVTNQSKVSINLKKAQVTEVLDEVLEGTSLNYRIVDRYIIIRKNMKEIDDVLSSVQQKGFIRGNVTDEDGNPLPGVSIVIKGTTIGVVTDVDGNFHLDNVKPDNTIIFSFVGMLSQEMKVGNQSEVKIKMETDAIGLDEVVAIGYGTMKKSSLTGSISRIATDKLEAFPVTNVGDAMQGKAAGIFVAPSVLAGDEPSIRIRGERSLKASSDPLIIVDGVPGSFENLNSSDIESMEVLKDAAATAVYGSRAANGVILITTKSAKKGKMAVEINSYAGVNHYEFIEMQSPQEFAEFIRDVKRANAHGYTDVDAWQNSPITTEKALQDHNQEWYENYTNNNPYDWQSALFAQNAPLQGHHISISSSSEKTSFRLSYSFQQDKAYYKTHDYKKHILTSNINHKFNKYISGNVITRLSHRVYDKYPKSMWQNLKRMNPLEHPYDEEGNLKDQIGNENYINALWTYEPGHFVDENKKNLADVIFKLEVKPTEYLTYTTNYKVSYSDYRRGVYYDSRSLARNLGYNFAQKDERGTFEYTWNNILTFDKTFNEDHHLNVTAVVEAQEDTWERTFAQGEDIPAQYMEYHFLETGIENQKLGSQYEKKSLLSYLGRLQYEYKGKYLFNAAVRRDGSSRLADGNKWATFPSASVAWRMSEEDFLKDNSLISNLKVRASYGVVGNQAIDPYQTLTRLKSKTYSWDDKGFYTWQPEGLANKALTWEISSTINGGVDFGILNNRLSGSVEVYKTTNDDLLLKRQLPETTGFGSIWQNIGKTENSGFELTLNGSAFQTRDFTWDLTGTFSRNWNKIVELLDGKDDVGSAWFIGEPLRVWYEYEKLGIWQLDEQEEAAKYGREVGEVKVWDNGDFQINNDDKKILGQKDPKWMASLISTMKYKNFDFSFTINAMGGHLIKASKYGSVEYNGDKWITSGVDYWTPLNPTNEFPRVQKSQQSNRNSGALGFYNGTHAKVQEMTLGYDFSKLLNKLTKVQRARVYVQAKNAFYLFKHTPDDVHPEVPSIEFTLPTSFVCGVNLSF
ncbi:SusC/RagA family TonB-linked outer membrane protein [Prolixibacteraceae bacterium JC049]|nr:SusC/RagA family TonB-linked outer membrane protein [Prolixibacteraceae bacterium JC049]